MSVDIVVPELAVTFSSLVARGKFDRRYLQKFTVSVCLVFEAKLTLPTLKLRILVFFFKKTFYNI